MPFAETVLGLAALNDWLGLGLTFILSTLIGGLVITGLVAVASRAWGESVKPANAFLIVLLINLINLIGVLGFLGFLGVWILIIPLLVWILLTKTLFSQMRWLHAGIIGIVGYVISIYIIPILSEFVIAVMPF